MARIVNYFKESYDELVNKVSWPSWAELQSSAIVVSIAALVFALMIFVMDFIFGVHPGIKWWSGILEVFYRLIGG